LTDSRLTPRLLKVGRIEYFYSIGHFEMGRIFRWDEGWVLFYGTNRSVTNLGAALLNFKRS